jgi:hypothetical protein
MQDTATATAINDEFYTTFFKSSAPLGPDSEFTCPLIRLSVLTNLQKLEGLVAAIKASVDPATGKLAKCKLLLYALLLL